MLFLLAYKDLEINAVINIKIKINNTFNAQLRIDHLLFQKFKKTY